MTSDAAAVRTLLTDAFGRIRELVEDVTSDLSDAVATYRPDAQANSISWLLWHLSRVQDDHIAGLADAPQRYVSEGWAEKFDLPFDPGDIGYGQTSTDVGKVRAGARMLADYHAAVHAATIAYLDTLTAGELERVVDRSWDPPVTVAVRLVSVEGDCLQHLGQAAYVKGMAQRAGVA
ncbi:DinB family protein [Hoyosella sp. YIM 151337]|uniref:mycothiol transferase n=1 Tax=Hoyosella sp. YIM 151337 TaxID=2992742 RepID=UPI002235DD02|nr:DinB family protein [Hoyosella sp. YIM 151337]MCW4353792.1 DinB family protein [Hoyosella sp. YIM 151337]